MFDHYTSGPTVRWIIQCISMNSHFWAGLGHLHVCWTDVKGGSRRAFVLPARAETSHLGRCLLGDSTKRSLSAVRCGQWLLMRLDRHSGQRRMWFRSNSASPYIYSPHVTRSGLVRNTNQIMRLLRARGGLIHSLTVCRRRTETQKAAFYLRAPAGNASVAFCSLNHTSLFFFSSPHSST